MSRITASMGRWRCKPPIRPPQSRSKSSFIRFVTPHLVAGASRRSGIFGAAHDLAESDSLDADVRDALDQELSWFQANLPIPKKSAFSKGKGICWFKQD